MEWTQRINSNAPPKQVSGKAMMIRRILRPVFNQLTTLKQPVGINCVELPVYWVGECYYFPWTELKPYLGGKVTEAQVRDIEGVCARWILPTGVLKPRLRLLIPYSSFDQVMKLVTNKQSRLYLYHVNIESKLKLNREVAELEAMLSDDSRDSSDDYDHDDFVCSDDEIDCVEETSISTEDFEESTPEQFVQRKKPGQKDEQVKRRKTTHIISDD